MNEWLSASLMVRSDQKRLTRIEQQFYIDNECKWRDYTRFYIRRREWSVWSDANGASEAAWIKLEKLNFSGGIAPQHPISGEYLYCIYCTQTWRRNWSWRFVGHDPDTTAGGFPALLDLVEQVQCSNGGYFSHGWREKRAGWEMSGVTFAHAPFFFSSDKRKWSGDPKIDILIKRRDRSVSSDFFASDAFGLSAA